MDTASLIQVIEFEIKMLKSRAARTAANVASDLGDVAGQLNNEGSRCPSMDSNEFILMLADLQAIKTKEDLLETLKKGAK